MAKGIDIIDVMLAVHKGELKILVSNGFFLLQNVKSGEAVRLNEAEPVRHGRWILGNVEPGYCTPGGNRPWLCSECGVAISWRLDRPNENYCPNCGAKMDKEAE